MEYWSSTDKERQGNGWEAPLCFGVAGAQTPCLLLLNTSLRCTIFVFKMKVIILIRSFLVKILHALKELNGV